MIDSTYIKAHAVHEVAGEDINRTERVPNSKLYLIVDEMGSRAMTSGTVADCSQAPLLIDGFEGKAFLADKAYDINELLDHA